MNKDGGRCVDCGRVYGPSPYGQIPLCYACKGNYPVRYIRAFLASIMFPERPESQEFQHVKAV